ncbi:ComF family protein [Candidatus Woesebacteria bacterium]|nr:ComF family protein [Candidatus Woesebacteria bacterium]
MAKILFWCLYHFIASVRTSGDLIKVIIKLKNTLTQVGLRGDSRRKNLKNAFGINKEKLNRNKNYLIFDDVLTTGSTIDEIRLEFKKTGIFKVFSLTLAR